jgi:hypothetical protein
MRKFYLLFYQCGPEIKDTASGRETGRYLCRFWLEKGAVSHLWWGEIYTTVRYTLQFLLPAVQAHAILPTAEGGLKFVAYEASLDQTLTHLPSLSGQKAHTNRMCGPLPSGHRMFIILFLYSSANSSLKDRQKEMRIFTFFQQWWKQYFGKFSWLEILKKILHFSVGGGGGGVILRKITYSSWHYKIILLQFS